MDDLVKKTTLTKGAFYHQFPTKLALGYAVVDEVLTQLILERWIIHWKPTKIPSRVFSP